MYIYYFLKIIFYTYINDCLKSVDIFPFLSIKCNFIEYDNEGCSMCGLQYSGESYKICKYH